MGKILDLIPGLGQIKLSATTVFYLVIALVLMSLAGYGWYEAHEIKTMETAAGQAKQQITDLTNTNKTLAGQLKAQLASGAVNDTVTTTDVNQKNVVQTNTDAVVTAEQKQVNAVVQKYQPQGPAQTIPAAQAQAESEQIATTQINAMWQSYCQALPASTTGCAAVPTNTSQPAAPAASSAPDAQVGPVAMK